MKSYFLQFFFVGIIAFVIKFNTNSKIEFNDNFEINIFKESYAAKLAYIYKKRKKRAKGFVNSKKLSSQCKGKNKNGRRCGNITKNQSRLCWQHE